MTKEKPNPLIGIGMFCVGLFILVIVMSSLINFEGNDIIPDVREEKNILNLSCEELKNKFNSFLTSDQQYFYLRIIELKKCKI